MKKLIAVTGTILIAYVIFSAAYGPASQGPGQPGYRAGDTGVVYRIGEENGRVVVYRDDALYLRTDTPVSSLPKHDRIRLREGITVFSESELKRLVEDLCS